MGLSGRDQNEIGVLHMKISSSDFALIIQIESRSNTKLVYRYIPNIDHVVSSERGNNICTVSEICGEQSKPNHFSQVP